MTAKQARQEQNAQIPPESAGFATHDCRTPSSRGVTQDFVTRGKMKVAILAAPFAARVGTTALRERARLTRKELKSKEQRAKSKEQRAKSKELTRSSTLLLPRVKPLYLRPISAA